MSNRLNKPNKFKKVKLPATSWLKNVGKSIGYSSMDIVSDIMPTSIDLIQSNKDFVSGLVRNVKEMRRGQNNTFGKLIRSKISDEYIGIGKDALKNAKSDFASGKFYNKERINDFSDDMDFDFDIDSDFDDSSFDEDGEETSTQPKQERAINVISNINANNPMVQSINTQSEIMINGTEAMLTQNKELNIANMSINREVGNMLYGGLGTLNENVKSLIMFQSDSVAKHISASMQYYGDVMSRLDKLIELQEKNSSGKNEDLYSNKDESSYEKVFGFGAPKLEEYANVVKKQFKNAMSNNLYISTIQNILSDKDTLGSIAKAPLQFISTFIAKQFIPEFLKKTLENFDKSLTSFFPALSLKLEKLSTSSNPILQFLSSVFGINDKTKSYVDTSKYNKGEMSFNGITQKAIVEVIPGYLSRMLAVLEGKNALVYDYENGRFTSYSNMKKDEDRKLKNTTLGGYDDISTLKERLDAFEFTDRNEKQRLTDTIDELFMKVTENQGLVNPHKYTDKDGDVKDDLKELIMSINSNNSTDDVELIRTLITSLDKNQVMKMFGRDVYEARSRKNKYYQDQEEDKDGTYARALYNDLYKDIKLTETIDGKLSDKKNPFSSTDKYGFTQGDYLHKIYRTLVSGINVFVTGRGKASEGYNYDDFRNTDIRKISMVENSEEKDRQYKMSDKKFSESSIENLRRSGVMVTENVHSLGDDTNATADHIKNYMDIQKSEEEKKVPLINKLMGADLSETIRRITDIPANMAKKLFMSFDNMMYTAVFGGTSEGKNSFAHTFLNKIGNKLTAMADTLATKIHDKLKILADKLNETIFLPLKEALIGKDGIITKMKNSDMFKKVKTGIGKGMDYLFGLKNEEGNRENGLFTDVYDEMKSQISSVKYFINGKDNEDSVFSHFRGMVSEFTGTMKEYLFGSKDKDEIKQDIKGTVGGILGSIKNGIGNFTTAIFGTEAPDVDKITESIKAKAPKALATGIAGAGAGLVFGGKLGLLGSLFLPGGPIGGAIVGTTVGFLSQSENFKKWAFGDKDELTGERMGGIITQQTQEFFKKHKVPLVGGLGFGVLKGGLGALGFLPSFLVGGPITGAMTAVGLSMITKSEKFKNVMFGELDENGDRVGGFLSTIGGKLKNGAGKLKSSAGNMLVGGIGGSMLGLTLSKFGVVGATLFNPILGAAVGIASGLALSNDKMTKAIFGEVKYDDDGNKYRVGGMLGQIQNFIMSEVINPFKFQLLKAKFNITDWFDEKIAEPFLMSLDPIKEEFKRIGDTIGDFIRGIKENVQNSFLFRSFKDGLLTPLLNGFQKHIFQPFKTIMTTTSKFVMKSTGNLISLPFKILEMGAKSLFNKHRKQGIAKVRQQLMENLKENIVNSELYQDVKKVILDPLHTAFYGKYGIITMAKKGMSSLYKFTKLFIKKSIGLVFKSAWNLIKLPFTAINTMYKGGKAVSKFIKDRLYNPDVMNKDRMDKIKAGGAKTTDVLKNLLSLANPFGQVRHDAKYGEYGASYEPDRERGRRKRADAREERKAKEQEILDNMKAKLDSSQRYARRFNYQNDDNIDSRKYYQSIDKQMSSQYGKDWSQTSKLEKDSKLTQMMIQDSNEDIKDNTSRIVEKLTETNKLLKNFSGNTSNDLDDLGSGTTPNLSSKFSADIKNPAMDSISTDVIGDMVDDTPDGRTTTSIVTTENIGGNSTKITADEPDTYENQLLRSQKEEKEKKEMTFKEKMLSIVGKLTGGSESHWTGWDSIFSKKGLITGGLLLLAPQILKLINAILKWLKNKGFDFDFDDAKGAAKEGWDAVTDPNEYWNSEDKSDLDKQMWNENKWQALIQAITHPHDIKKVGGFIGKGVSNLFGNTKLGKLISKIANHGNVKAGKAFNDAISVLIKNPDELASAFKKTGDDILGGLAKSGDDIAGGAGKGADDVAGLFGKMLDDIKLKSAESNFAKTGDDILGGLAKSGDDIVGGAGKGADDVAGLFGKMLDDIETKPAKSKFAKNADDVVSKFVKNMCDAANKLLPKSKKIDVGAVTKKVTKQLTSEIGEKGMQEAGLKMAAKGGENLTLGTVLPILDVAIDTAIGVYDIIVAMSSDRASDLFLVAGEDVDVLMKLIAAQMDFCLEQGWLFVFEIFDDLLQNMTSHLNDGVGFSFRRWIAVCLYEALIVPFNNAFSILNIKDVKISKLFSKGGGKYLSDLLNKNIINNTLKTDQENLFEDYQSYLQENNLTHNDYPIDKYISDNWDTTGWKKVEDSAKNWVAWQKGDQQISNKIEIEISKLKKTPYGKSLQELEKNGGTVDWQTEIQAYKDMERIKNILYPNSIPNNMFLNPTFPSNSGFPSNSSLPPVEGNIVSNEDFIESYNNFQTELDSSTDYFGNLNKTLDDFNNETMSDFNKNTDDLSTSMKNVNSVLTDSGKNGLITSLSSMVASMFGLSESTSSITDIVNAGKAKRSANNPKKQNIFTTMKNKLFGKGGDDISATSRFVSNTYNGEEEFGVGGSSDMLDQYRKTSGYGYRDLDGDGVSNMHRGVDLVKGKNTPIQSFTNGTVVKVVDSYAPDSGSYGTKGYGNHVLVKSDDGKYSLYGHLNATNVSTGQKVNQGDQLGIEGHTGNSTGSHLHYEVRNSEDYGTDINPEDYLRQYLSSNYGINSSNTDTSTESEDYGFAKLTSELSELMGNIYSPFTNINDELSSVMSLITGNAQKDTSSAESALNASTSDSTNMVLNGENVVPKTLEDAIALKTYQLTFQREGNGYNNVNPNDNGAFGFGTMGYTRSAANTLLTQIGQKVGGSKGARILEYANKTGGKLSASEDNDLEALLNDSSVSGISKSLQDSYGMEITKGTNMKVPLDMYKKGEFLDPRSVVISADIANTSPASIGYWRDKYKPTSNKSKDLENVWSSLKSTDSWWGRTKNNPDYKQYYKGYMNRIDKNYQELQNWSPQYGGQGGDDMTGLNIRDDSVDGFIKMVENSPNNKQTFGIGGDSLVKSMSTNKSSNSNKNNAFTTDLSPVTFLMDKVIKVLDEISTNTGTSSNTLEEIKSISLETTSNNQTTNQSKPTKSSPKKKTSNYKSSDDYSIAKAIASGGR